jgi:uncharacterized protein YndB with AHSA1/START domain
MASVTASLVIPAPLDDVWNVVADVANARRWNAAWTRIEITSEQKQGKGTRFRTHIGDGDGAFDFEISEWVPPTAIAFSPIRDPSEQVYEITLDYHAFKLHAEDGQNTRVELTAHATTRGIRGRLVGLLFWPGHQKAGLQQALKSLGAVFGMEADGEA